MKKVVSLRALAMLVILIMVAGMIIVSPTTVFAIGSTYYVDTVNGNDSSNGTSESLAWQSLSKVNATTFQPGDRILFKSGGSWSGQLYPKGSGASGSPIVIDMYGTGSKPIINGGGTVKNTVYLFNQQYWEINNLEITNDSATEAERRGVEIEAADFGIVNHIYLKNLYIHNIKGYNGPFGPNDHKKTGGINFQIFGSNTPTKYNDILIEGCSLYNVDRSGIQVAWTSWMNRGGQTSGAGPWYGSTNVIIRNNTLDNIQGDGIVTLHSASPLVENNVSKDANSRSGTASAGIWTWESDDAIFQYNEAYLTRTTIDGYAFDCDIGNRTIYQYNYSHDNEGGFMAFFGTPDGWVAQDSIVRYNISQNDQCRLFSSIYGKNSQVYNNTFYIRPGLRTPTFDAIYGSCYLYNNIFYNLGYNTADWGGFTYDYNVFYGNFSSTPNDAHKLTSDPQLSDPGNGGIGRTNVDGYKLLAASPCINSGMIIANNGGKDYWGNTLYNGNPDRGAHEYTGDPGPTPIPVLSSYQASVDFSSTQGGKQWYYKQKNGSTYTDMTWDAVNNRWNGSYTYCLIGSNWQHPDTNDSARAWVAPKNGTIRITCNGNIRMSSPGGDGVKVSLIKNSTVIWGPQLINAGDTIGISFPSMDVSVYKGETIYFIVNQNGNNGSDTTYWDPIISYIPDPTPTPLSSYKSSVDFSSSQGYRQWYYKEKNGSTYSDMAWDAANKRWFGSSTYCYIGSNWQHPDTGDSARAWVAPKDGTVRITSNGNIYMSSPGGDGVYVSLIKNSTVIWGPQLINAGDYTGISFVAMSISVVTGDTLYFIVNKNVNNGSDSTYWDPVIEYEPIPTPTPTPTPTPPSSYQASAGFSSTQGSGQWYYKQKSGSTYTDMTWDAANNRWNGSYAYCLIGSNWQHPDTGDSARTWVAPKDGTVRITSNGNIHMSSPGGDGVYVSLIKNNTVIWGPQLINAGDTIGISFPAMNVSVVTGDTLYFIVNQNGNNNSDTTYWDPVINYIKPTNPGLETGDLTGWGDGWGLYSVAANNQYSESYCMKVERTSSVQQRVSGLKPNTTYVLSAWVKVANAGDIAYLGVEGYDGPMVASSTTSTSYSQLAVEFTTGDGKIDAAIYLYRPETGTGCAYGDDFKVREAAENLALNKTVTKSSSLEDGAWSETKAVDGQKTPLPQAMGWSSNDLLITNHTEWITVDLEENTYINKVNLYPRNDGANSGYGFPVDFSIKVSSDNINWTTVVTQTGYPKPDGTVQSFNFSNQSARYVRVEGISLRQNPNDSNSYRMQFAEIEVYEENRALNKTVTASSSVEDYGWLKAKVVDGIRTSISGAMGWSSNDLLTTNHTEWLTVDLGASIDIKKVNLCPRGDGVNSGYGFPVDFTIKVSNDNVNWTTVITQTGYLKPNGTPQSFVLNNQNARYIKIEGTNLRQNPYDSNSYRMQFTEIEIF